MISMYKKAASYNKKNIAYQKTNGICIICSRQVSSDMEKWSVEHYIPRAIYKWVPSQQLRDVLESVENLFIVHQKCNERKDADLPTIKSIHHLPISSELKLELLQLYKSVESEISEYRAIKQSVLSSQNALCYFCNHKICMLNSTLRRLDNKKQRIATNAMCLCLSCSIRAGNPSYKRKIVKQKLSNSNIKPEK